MAADDMPLLRIAFACLALLVPAGPLHAADDAARLKLTISGLKPELEEAVRSGLTLQQYRDRAVSEAQLRRLVSRGEEEIIATLEAWGHYSGAVKSLITPGDAGDFDVTFAVDPGEPTLVTKSRVAVDGDAAKVPAVASSLDAFVPRMGERFDHAQYEASKAAVAKALGDAGFLGAKLVTHRVEVQAARRSASIELAWDGGPRYQFGPTRFHGGQFAPELMDRYMPWRAGDEYSSAKLLDMQQRLVGADYFSTVTVQPHPEKAVGGAVPVDVELTPAKRDIYSAALYASTDRGAGVDFSVQRRWLNDQGHKGQAEFDVAQRLKAVELSYRIPLPGERQRMLSMAGTYRDEETESSVSQTEKLAANVARKWGGYTLMYGLQFLAGDFEIGSEDGNSSLLFFEGAFTRSRSDLPTFARRGFGYTLTVRGTPFEQATDTRFGALDLEVKWLRAFGTATRLILRGELGGMKVDDFDLLPPELRFFAGGDRSIRGFGYEEIGSRNEAGDVIGGNRLIEASVELEYYWRRNLGLAVFVDSGDAFLGEDFVLHAGAGAGIRWKSPVGVLRLDLAYPVKSIDASGWQIHFNIGPDF
jgi:translocation and assembly module TamA